MNAAAMHAASASIFEQMLNNLNVWLDKAQEHASARSFDAELLLQSRLAPDMLSLSGQISLATAFAKNAMCRLAGQEPPDFPDVEKSIADYRARIARALDIVRSISADSLEGAAARMITVRVGPEQTMTMTGQDYLLRFAAPNFYFHLVTAYDILRHNGVVLGKRDFLAGAL